MMRILLLTSLITLIGQGSTSPVESFSSFSDIDGLAIVAGLGVQYTDFVGWDRIPDVEYKVFEGSDGIPDFEGSDGIPVFPPLPPPMASWEVLYPDRCSLPSFPKPVTDAVATATDNAILVCGGEFREDQKSKILQSCHQLKNREWLLAPSMLQSRTNAAAVKTKDGWLVTGGSDDTSKFLDSMEIFHDGGWTMMSSKLPEAAQGHCIVAINASTLFFTGGYIKHHSGSGYTYSDQANMFNTETGEWARKADMRQDRAWHECFKMGDKVVVAGGLIHGTERFVETFDLKSEEWKNESDLPEAVDKAGYVNIGDDVMVLGAGDEDNKILRFMWIDGELRVTIPIEKYSTLQKGRAGGIFLKVNKQLLNCK